MSLVNTVLATITAAAFKEFADAIEKGQAPAAVARAALQSAWKVGGAPSRSHFRCNSMMYVCMCAVQTVFNGNGYDPENQAALTSKGLWRIDSGVDAICRYTVRHSDTLTYIHTSIPT